MNDFFEQVYALVARIPRGNVASYGQIARWLGHPHAARAVGWAMRCCPDDLPAQRVIRADGSFPGDLFAEMRRETLEAEGVPFLPDGRVDIAACRWLGNADTPEDPEESAAERPRKATGKRAGRRSG